MAGRRKTFAMIIRFKSQSSSVKIMLLLVSFLCSADKRIVANNTIKREGECSLFLVTIILPSTICFSEI